MRRILALVMVALGVFASTRAAAESEGEPPCDDPVLWMAQHGVEGFAEPWCARCGLATAEETKQNEEECHRQARSKAEALVAEDQEGATSTDSLSHCTAVEFRIQLIRAWYGRSLDDASWRELVEQRPWFGKRRRASYPGPATEILKRLEARRALCQQRRSKVEIYLRPALRAAKTGRFGHPAAVFAEGIGIGLRDELYLHHSAPPHPLTYGYRVRILEPPQLLGIYEDLIWAPPLDADSKFAQGPLTPWWRRQEVHAEVDLYSSSPFYCSTGECESGESVTLLVRKDGRLLGQTWRQQACPFVYTRTPTSPDWSYHGEILRNLRSSGLEAEQRLDVSAESSACDGQVELRLAEEKRETTHLDAVALEVGGERLLPAACGEEPSRAFCADDGVYEVIEEGQVLDLRFEIPARLRDSCRLGGMRAWADGYYVPRR